MKRVNKIMVLFFLVVSALVTFFWQAIQTEKFSIFFSEKLTKNFLKNSEAEMKFGKMEINFFPPSTVLKDISVSYRKGSKDGFNLNVDKIGLSYNISDLLSNKFKIRSFNVEGGEIFFNDKLFRKNVGPFLKRIKITEIFENYKKRIKDSQWINLRKISLKNFNVVFFDYKFDVSNLTIESLGENFKSNIRIVNIFNKNEIKILKDSPIDLITLSAVFKGKEILLEEFTLKSMMNRVKGRGGVKEKGKHMSLFLWGESSGDLGSLIKFGPDLIKGVDGPYRLNFKVEGTLDDPVLGVNFNTGKVSNKYLTINKMKGSINIKNEKIFLDKININDGSLLVGHEPIQIYSLKDKDFIFHKTSLTFKDIRFDEMFKFLEKKRVPLKGNLFGKAHLVLNENKLSINLDRNFFIKDFFFLDGSLKKPILQNTKINVGESSILLKDKGDIGLKLKISTLSSKAKIIGYLNKNSYRFICKDAFIDFNDLGPISGVPIFGKGKINLELTKKMKKKYLKIDLKGVKDFSILNFHLGKVTANLDLNLKTFFLNIKNFYSVVGKSDYKGEGLIGFDERGKIELNLDLRKIKFKDGEKIFGHYLKGILKKDLNLPLEFSTKFKVYGPLLKEKIKVKGTCNVKRFTYKGERIGPVSLGFSYNDEVTSIRNISLIKNGGKINAKVDFKNDFSFMRGNVSIKDLRLRDFDFYNLIGSGFSSDIVAEIGFEKDKNKLELIGDARLVNSRLKNKKIKDSVLVIKSKKGKIIAKGEVVGGILDFKSEVGYNRGNNNNSFFFGEINVDDIKDLLSIISLHNAENENIDGFIYGDIKSKFNIFDLGKMTTILNLERLNISKENIQIRLNKNPSVVEIRDGEIKKWDIRLNGGDNFVHTIGEGNLGKTFKVENIFKLNADWIEIFSPKVKVEGGSLGGRHVFFKNEKKFRSDLDLKGENINFNIENIPGSFEKFNFNFLGQNKDFLIQKFDLKYGKGDINVEGNIKANLPFPTLDLRYNISNSNVYFLENSNVIFSGKGKILGRDLPYVIEGDHLIFGGRVLDSLMAFSAKDNKESQYNQYLPKFKYLKRSNIINIKANFDIINPVVIKNNFSNLSFDGRVVAFGNVEDPLFKGRLNLIPRVSRFIFKGNEFILTDGFVSFNDEFRRVSPEVKFTGECVVGEFLIKLNIMGNSQSNKIEFSSTPTLSKEDIFSLLTFGVTTNDSQSLEESDRQSMTSIGLGSLLVEQFRLNEGITSSLGLKMSILPEFSEDVDSKLLHSQVGGEDSTGKIRSSTKIKIKKKLTETIDLSVSSTLGGSLEPTQEMNVDLKIDSNISLEGVYEIKSSTESDGESSNSAGADLKFQWSFK